MDPQPSKKIGVANAATLLRGFAMGVRHGINPAAALNADVARWFVEAPRRARNSLALPPLHAAQREIIATADRFNVLQCGRRFGKTVLGLHLAVDAAVNKQSPVGWFAPTYKLMLEQWEDALKLGRNYVTRSSRADARISFLGGGRIDFWSLEKPDAGRGRKYARIVIDEASVVRDLGECWQSAIRPTLTDLIGDAWFLGTPKGRNFFHRLYQKGQGGEGGWRSWRYTTIDNPYMKAEEVDGARADLPEHVFRQEYEGVPADDAGNPFGVDAIAACAIDEPTGQPPIVWGIDLAKSQDWTVCIGLDANGHVATYDRWQGPWERTIDRILHYVTSGVAWVDSTGVGDPIVEAVQKRAPGRFEGFKFTAQSKQQIMEGLALAIQQGTVRIPRGVILSELESFEYEYTRTGVRYSAPSGLHDDAVCALALAVAARRRQREPGNLGILF